MIIRNFMFSSGKTNESHGIAIPETFEAMTQLADKVMKAHANCGSQSPIGEILALQIEVKLGLARQRQEEAMQSPEGAQASLAQRDAILGIRPDANNDYGGTLKFYLQCVGEILVKDKNKNSLREFGFK